MDKSLIRNFCIIAHIDHGKSTLADRLLLKTGAISQREFHDQMLDGMDLERERGITIKAKAVRLNHSAGGKDYILNLIDTPGHVDFTYEVSKALAACEGVLLVVDAAQGVEAQTVANLYLAREHNLVIIPVINKIDLPSAEPDRVVQQLKDTLHLTEIEPIMASAKSGIGVDEIIQAIVDKIPAPKGETENPLQALIIDSAFDTFKGVVVYIRLKNGTIRKGMKIKMMGTGRVYDIEEVGVFKPAPVAVDELSVGEVGYITCNIKVPKEVHVGDTVTDFRRPAADALPGYKKVRPLVFCGLYPVNAKDFPFLRDALEKMELSDASFIYEVESSVSFGFGFRCGFLGLLHMEIIQERLEREYNLNLIATTPSVVYKVIKTNGETVEIENPSKLPAPQEIDEIEEPFIRAFVISPSDSLGNVMQLCQERRGEYKSTEYLDPTRAMLIYEFPLSEIIVDFYDKIKSMTRGYGSLDYEFKEYIASDLVKLDILINGKPCDALSFIIHKDNAHTKGNQLVTKLKELIPRQLFEVALQAAIGSKIIARETVRPVGKNVTAKCYGGDISRKRKLWEKQKEGKKRMKQFGKVEIPQEAFMAVLKL
ncbi:MAG: translation elongation factor 4 [Candidatus Omnitrophica bacterium]|nr:translation elongation factor 4 [Candidatus Omnitrophota bacterium]MDD5310923.1 translation elongation factor 4 [Candidatus Omnitrophota bacterium]